MQRGPDGRSLWLPDSNASCSDRECPQDDDTAPYCTVMNVWSVQQQQDRKVNTPDQASALEVSALASLSRMLTFLTQV